MITDMILHKYLRHLRHMDRVAVVHLDAVELALRLALDELEQSITSTPSTPPTELVALQANQLADLQAELERLQTAADAEVAELKQQIAELDTDNAALIRRNKELTDALHIAQNGTGLVIKNPPFVPLPHVTADAQPPSAISNPPISNSMWSDPNMLNTLDDIARDWWIGVAAGRHQWRSVPKPVQLQLVRHILSFGPETGPMKMSDFDAIKPDWMPGSGSHTKTLGLSWSQLNDWSIEL